MNETKISETKKTAAKKKSKAKTAKRATAKKSATTKRKTRAKKSSASTKTKKTVTDAGAEVPIKLATQEEHVSLRNSDEYKHEEVFSEEVSKRKINLKQCMSGLYKIAKACQPKSASGTIGVFLLGMLIGIAALIGFVYVSKNATLLHLLTGANILHSDGVTIQIEEEIDPSFNRLLAGNVPSDFEDVNLDDFWEVWRYIESAFVPPPEKVVDGIATGGGQMVDRGTLINGAIKGLTRATKDKYTNFYLPKDAADFEDEVLNGEIDGIGAYLTINKDGILEVAKPIEGGPADQAGLRAKDLIITIDGVDSSEYNLSEAADNIRGPRGTTVVLEIYRPIIEEKVEIAIVRDRVEIPTVETEIRDGVFIIQLSTFTKLTRKAFHKALEEFTATANAGGPDRILLDMRGNAGGILSESVHIAGLFLPENSPILYEYSGTEKLKVYKTTKPAFQNGVLPKMTILVDGATASAAEILAAALRHYGIADIVGSNTLGKGSVQAIKPVGNDNALLKITVAYWLTPSKESISGEGVLPDVDYLEEMEALYKADPETDIEEVVLQKAIDHLIQK